MTLRRKLLFSLGAITLIGLWPHDLWHQTVYYSEDSRGYAAKVIQGRYPPRARWVEVEVHEYPEGADSGWIYTGFDRYDHRFGDSILIGLNLSTGPNGVLSFALQIPACCVPPTIAGFMPTARLSYEVERGWRLLTDSPREWLR